jgi:hypothetical protein
LLVLVVALLAALPAAANAAAPVVAIVGENDGVNVLHADFRAQGPVEYPAGMPAPVFIDLPQAGTFEQRLAALAKGPLGSLPTGVLYAVRGTRLLFYNAGAPEDIVTPEETSFGPRVHGTGVIGAAISASMGTAPDAFAVYVGGGPASADAWKWIAAQRWIDIASLSAYTLIHGGTYSDLDRPLPTCESAAEARAAAQSGHAIFSSSGNSATPDEQQHAPNGLPEAYQVGGTDASGRAATPPHTNETDPWYITFFSQRFYDTGALSFFDSTGPDGYDARQKFGGTSSAAPKTAGYALRLIAAARRILGAGRNGTSALATLAPGFGPPARGPLSDGSFTVAELERVLHHTAIPAEPATPARYAYEGFGAVTDASIATALGVLDGTVAEPARPDEDVVHAAVEQARSASFGTKCA